MNGAADPCVAAPNEGAADDDPKEAAVDVEPNADPKELPAPEEPKAGA